MQGDSRIVEILLKSGANPSMATTEGITALHHAVIVGDIDCVKTLCRYGANLNVVNKDSQTPLLLAAQFELNDIASLLLKTGSAVSLLLIFIPSPLILFNLL
jgi:ankyrin repeat protein